LSRKLAESMLDRIMSTRYMDPRIEATEILQCLDEAEEGDRVVLWTRLITGFGLGSPNKTIALGRESLPDDWEEVNREACDRVHEFVSGLNRLASPREVAELLAKAVDEQGEGLDRIAFLSHLLHNGELVPYVPVSAFVSRMEENDVDGQADHHEAQRILATPHLSRHQKILSLIELLNGANDPGRVSILKTMASSPAFSSGSTVPSLIGSLIRALGPPMRMLGGDPIRSGGLFMGGGLEEMLQDLFPGADVEVISIDRGDESLR
jgi:hypothetical protein